MANVTKSAQVEDVRIPSLDEVHEPLKQKRKDVLDIQRALALVDSRIQKVLGPGEEDPPPQAPAAERARELLEDLDGALTRRRSVPSREARGKEYEALLQEKRDLLRELETAKREVDRLEFEASRIICTEVGAAWHDITRARVLALLQLAQADVDDQRFRNRLRDAGVKWSAYLPSIVQNGLGDPDNRNSVYARSFREAIAGGFISEAEIPKEWLEEWRR